MIIMISIWNNRFASGTNEHLGKLGMENSKEDIWNTPLQLLKQLRVAGSSPVAL
jgi:hypothetical protein